MPLSAIDIFTPAGSPGLAISAQVLRLVLTAIGVRVRLQWLPPWVYQQDAERNGRQLKLAEPADAALFVERLFEHPQLARYPQRICVPHPEWFESGERQRVGLVTAFWHPTRHGQRLFTARYPQIPSHYTGFTSLDPGDRVADHVRFGHFPGKAPYRSTQAILDAWLAHPDWPTLSVNVYGNPPMIALPDWLEWRNLRLKLGFLPLDAHRAELRAAGVHLCTSEVEGFGHGLNEARALGALVVTLAAPPMTELIDADCGLLVPTTDTPQPQALGLRYPAAPGAIAAAVEQVLAIPMTERARLGAAARARYEADRQDFARRLAARVRGD